MAQRLDELVEKPVLSRGHNERQLRHGARWYIGADEEAGRRLGRSPRIGSIRQRKTNGPCLVNRFWDSILRQLLEAARAQRIVEVGVARGLLTEKVLEYCAASGAVSHAIDPLPQIDVDEWLQRHGERLVFHRAPSLDVLNEIHDVDVALIDGDHNWFTVYHELMMIEETALTDDRRPPVIALHDVDWPYGRRDMYYDPDTIPEAHRQPYRRLGLVPGRVEPVHGGVNWDLANAVVEDSPHNGVRTAVEDFIAASQLEWEVVYVPGFHGLGIAASKDRIDGDDALRVTIDTVGTPAFLESWARELDLARIGSEIEANAKLSNELAARERELTSGVEERLAETDRLRELVVDAERRLAGVPDLQARIGELENELSEARKAADRTREQIGELDQRVTQGQEVLSDVFSSPSWRLTQPLRTAKHSASRMREILGR